MFQPIGLPRHEGLVDEIEFRGEELGVIDRQQDRVLIRPGDDRAIVLRVEREKVVLRQLCELGGKLHIHALRRVDDGKERRIGQIAERQVVAQRIGDDILHRL